MDDDLQRELRRVLRHDVRTPLAVILGRCELLETMLQGELNEAQLSAIVAVRRNAERLSLLLDDAVGLLDVPVRGVGGSSAD